MELELELGQADGASAHANAEEADGQVTAGATGDDKASPDRVIPATAPNIDAYIIVILGPIQYWLKS